MVREVKLSPSRRLQGIIRDYNDAAIFRQIARDDVHTTLEGVLSKQPDSANTFGIAIIVASSAAATHQSMLDRSDSDLRQLLRDMRSYHRPLTMAQIEDQLKNIADKDTQKRAEEVVRIVSHIM